MSRAIWSVSLPLVFAEISETIVHVTDTAFLARVGVAELGAIAIADCAYELGTVAVVALVDGIQILTARRAGQRRDAAVGATFNQGLGLLVIVSLALTVALYTASSRVAGLLVVSDEVAAPAETFLRIIALGTVFHAVNLAYSVLFVALSRTRVLIPATLVLAGTNVVLDYGLVLGNLGLPRMGIAGAAWGSVGAELAACVYLTLHAYRHLDIARFGLFRLPRFERRLVGSLGSLSAPVALQAFLEGLRWLLFFVLAEQMGETVLAASNVIYSVYVVLLIPTEGFSETACSMASRLIGRGRPGRIGALMWEVTRPGYLVTLPLAALVALFPGALLSLFIGDPQVIAASVPCLRVIAAAMLVVVPGEMWFAAVTGTGDTGAAFVIELAFTGAMLAFAYVAGVTLDLPLEYVWTSVPLGSLLCLSLSYAWIRAGRWKRLVH